MKKLVLALLLLASPASAATYYVDCAADGDAGAGTSTAANVAWKTINKVNTSSFSAGDSVLFKKGCTFREQLTVPSSGSAGSVVTFGAYGTGAAPIISGADVISTWTVPSAAEESGGVFATGMESEVDAYTSVWTNKATANSNTIVVTTDAAGLNNGAKAGKITYAGTGVQGTYVYKDIAAQTNLYYRLYFKLATGFDMAANNNEFAMFSMRDTNWGETIEVVLIRDAAGSFHLRGDLIRPQPTTTLFTGANGTILPNTWYRLEIYYKKDAATGGGQVWLDGVSQGSNFVKNTNAYSPNYLSVGCKSTTSVGAPTAGSILYFDDVKADTSAVGAFSAAPPANVYEAACATQPYQFFRDGLRSTLGAGYASLNDHEWFWATNKCYYKDASGDPDLQGYTLEASTRTYNVNVNGKNYVTLTGLNLTKSNSNGIGWSAASTNTTITGNSVSYAFQNGIRSSTGAAANSITVSNNTVDWNGASGIFVGKGSHDWTISGNTVFRNSHYADSTGDHNFTSGIHAWCDDGSITNLLIERNTVYENGKLVSGSYITGARGVGIWTDTLTLAGYTPYAIIRYNRVYDNGYVGIHVEHGTYHQVYYNVVSGTVDGDGIRIGDYSHVAGMSVASNVVYNNTVYSNNYTGLYFTGANGGAAGTCVNNTAKNNLAYSNGRDLKIENGCENDGVNGSGNVYLYNGVGVEGGNIIEWATVVKTTVAAFDTAYGSATHTLAANPLFVAAGSDYHLQATSPAINAGVDVGLVTDFVGTSINNTPDIGAYEWPIALPSQTKGVGTPLSGLAGGLSRYDKTTNMPGLVMFLQLGEPAGAIKGDYAGNFPFLEKVDGVGTITSVAGKIGNATEFSGETSYIQPAPNSVAGDGKIAMPTGDFTLSMWFYPKSGSGNQYLFSYGANDVSGTVTLHMWNNLPMGVRCFTTAATPAETANLPVINSWNYVSCWHDSATHTNYVQLNGGAIASAAGVEAALPQYTRIARHAGMGANFVGIIDAVGVWNRILTAGEQTANQAGIEPPF